MFFFTPTTPIYVYVNRKFSLASELDIAASVGRMVPTSGRPVLDNSLSSGPLLVELCDCQAARNLLVRRAEVQELIEHGLVVVA